MEPFPQKPAACIGEPIGGCATRRMLPTLMQTACWRNRCPHLDNFSAPCRLAENASAGAAMAGSDQASPGRRTFPHPPHTVSPRIK
jgi:hypothetical protein